MALVPYTLVSWAESDATGTNGKNIIENAVVSLFLPGTSTAITLYDNASSGNPSTTKTTGTDGQVTFWCETGNYDLEVNGQARGTISVATALEATTGPDDTIPNRVTTVGDFGIGRIISGFLADADTIAFSGIAQAGGTTANTPDGVVGYLFNTSNSPASTSQILMDRTGSNRIFYRKSSGGTFTGWTELYHTGNLELTTSATDTTAGRVTKVGDFGLGAENSNTLVNLDLSQPTQFAFAVTGTTSGSFPDSQNAGLVIHLNRGSDSQFSQLFFSDQNQDADSDRVYFRSRDSEDFTGGWQEIFHTGNLNVNEFGNGGSPGDKVATGFPISATQAEFDLQTESFTVTSSITVPPGETFRVVDIFSGSILVSGVVPTYSARSTATNTLVLVSGMTGLVSSQALRLEKETANATITVNF